MPINTVEEALDNLKSISPMPNDDEVTEEQLEAFENVLDFFSHTKDERIIEPLIYSLGYGLGYGLYAAAIGLLETFDQEKTTPLLVNALKIGHPGNQLWAIYALKRRRLQSIVPILVDLLAAPQSYIRADAISALRLLGDDSLLPEITKLQNDIAPEVRRAVEKVVKQGFAAKK